MHASEGVCLRYEKKTVAGCVECLPYFNYLFYCLCMSSFLKKVRENTIWFKGINHSHLLNWVKNVLNSSFVDCKTEICQPTRRQIVCSTWKQGFLFFLVFFFGGAVLVFLKFCLSNPLTYFKLMNNLLY